MFNIGLIALLSIDLLFLAYGKIKVYWVFSKNIIKKIREESKYTDNRLSDSDKKETVIDEDNSKRTSKYKLITWIKEAFIFIFKWLLVIVVIIFILALILAVIGIATSYIWGTILLAIYKNFVYASVFLISINTVFFVLGFGGHKALKIDKSVTQRALIMDIIQFSMLILLLFFAAFGYPINIIDIIITPYQWNIVLNNFVSILIPMLFFSTITINFLAVVFRIKNMLTKDRSKHWTIRIHQLLFIFIASGFIGILFLTDIDLSFMNDVERTMYFHTLEVVKWIVTSAFIPMFLYSLNNFKNSKSHDKFIYLGRNNRRI
jgi:hypothetical protein